MYDKNVLRPLKLKRRRLHEYLPCFNSLSQCLSRGRRAEGHFAVLSESEMVKT